MHEGVRASRRGCGSLRGVRRPRRPRAIGVARSRRGRPRRARRASVPVAATAACGRCRCRSCRARCRRCARLAPRARGGGERVVVRRPRRARRRRAPPRRTARSASGNTSRNRPEMRSVTSTRGRPKLRGRQDLEAGDARRAVVPHGPHAEQRHGLGEVVAAGAHGGAAPEVDDDACAASRHGPARSARRPRRRCAGRSPRPCGWGRRAGRRCRGCARSAARRAGRASGAPAGPGARSGRRARRAGRASRRRRRRRGRDGAGARRGRCVSAERSSRRAGSGAAEDVQAVADAHLLEVAEPGVERRAARSGIGSVGVRCRLPAARPVSRGPVEDGLRRAGGRGADRAPAASAYSSNSASSSAAAPCWPASISGGVRWPMRDGGEPALGLRGLAGIVDDEGIDDRHGPEHGLRRAVFVERHGLAGQPFQRAVRAEMDERVDALRRRAARDRTRHRRGAAAGSGRGSRPCAHRAGRGRAAARRSACRAHDAEAERAVRRAWHRPAGRPRRRSRHRRGRRSGRAREQRPR